jgi:hypothetical protein
MVSQYLHSSHKPQYKAMSLNVVMVSCGSKRYSPRSSQIEGESDMASAAIDDSFKTVPTDMSRPLFSDSLGFYSCEDDGIDPLNVAQLQEIHSNRSTLPANVFVIQTELGNGKDSNGRDIFSKMVQLQK